MAFDKTYADEVLTALKERIARFYRDLQDYLVKKDVKSSADALAMFNDALAVTARANDALVLSDLIALDVLSIAITNFAHTTTGTATVTLTGAAPVGGAVVDLTSSDEAVATVPVTVTVLEGHTTATYTVTGVAAGATDLGASIGDDDPVTHTLTLS